MLTRADIATRPEQEPTTVLEAQRAELYEGLRDYVSQLMLNEETGQIMTPAGGSYRVCRRGPPGCLPAACSRSQGALGQARRARFVRLTGATVAVDL